MGYTKQQPQDREQIDDGEYDKPVSKGGGDLPPLPFLPDREWLSATIVSVEYRYAMRKGQYVYVEEQVKGSDEQRPVLDENGEPVKRREFNVKFELDDYYIPNAKVQTNRCVWVNLTASLNDKANLPKFLKNVGLDVDKDDVSPKSIIKYLTNLEVELQLKNMETKVEKKPYQVVVYDAVRKYVPRGSTAAKKDVPQEECLY